MCYNVWYDPSFQIEKKGNKSRVYLSGAGYVIDIPNNLFRELQLSPSLEQERELKSNDYVRVQDEVGIVLFAEDYEKPLCYFPSFQQAMYIEEYEILEKK